MKIVSHFPLAPAGRRHRARSRASITRPRAAQISRLAELPSISFARTNSRIDRCLFRMGDNQSHYQGRREKRPTSLPVRNDGRGPSRGSRKSSRWNFFLSLANFFSVSGCCTLPSCFRRSLPPSSSPPSPLLAAIFPPPLATFSPAAESPPFLARLRPRMRPLPSPGPTRREWPTGDRTALARPPMTDGRTRMDMMMRDGR